MNAGDAVEVYGIEHWEVSYSLPSGTRIKGVLTDLDDLHNVIDQLLQEPGARLKVRVVEAVVPEPSVLEVTAKADERAHADFIQIAVRNWSEAYAEKLWGRNVSQGYMWFGVRRNKRQGWVHDSAEEGLLNTYLEIWGDHE